MEIADAMEIIYEGVSDAADIIWGTTTDSSLREDYVKATVILTGIDNIYAVSNNHSYTIE